MSTMVTSNAITALCTLLLSQRYTDQQWSEGNERVEELQNRLNQFLTGVERSAFRMAEIAVGNPDDAMDIVQDAMIKLVEKYADKPAGEWKPLFYRILHSRITDFYRKKALLKRIFFWVADPTEDNELAAGPRTESGPMELLTEQLTLEHLIEGLRNLPLRQQQAFLLRNWQGMSVAETSRIMKCSEGSVKTHLFRATHALKKLLNIMEQGDLDDQT